jgi:hypothetical protein
MAAHLSPILLLTSKRLHKEPTTANHAIGFALIALGPWFVFQR